MGLRELHQRGEVTVSFCPGNLQLADILTKTQTSSKIDPHLSKIFCTLPDHLISTEI